MAKRILSQIDLFQPFFHTGESIGLKTVVDDTSITCLIPDVSVL